ncbi:MAG: hypothetical protein ACK5LC_04265 [Coprobacillaceae bacterium]
MKKFFVAIRQQKIDEVKTMLEKKPELISCTAKQPPKKDDGQSPLQVAIKSSKKNYEIVHLLLDLGTDVNFIEDESCCNKWRAPVLHDAIMAAVYCARRTTEDYFTKEVVITGTKEEANNAYQVLKRVLEMGADVHQVDSFGNSGLARVLGDASIFLPNYNYVENTMSKAPVSIEQIEDLKEIFDLLFSYGANIDQYSLNFKMTLREFYQKQYVMKIIKEYL